jgi:hypothetical protein
LRVEGGGDFVADGHAALFDNSDGREIPAGEQRQKLVEKRRSMALDGQRGEAVGDDEGEVEGACIAGLIRPRSGRCR